MSEEPVPFVNAKCANCKFYYHKDGTCRAQPPSTYTSQQNEKWPRVTPEDWCGHWQSN